jgi:hypothetical protein
VIAPASVVTEAVAPVIAAVTPQPVAPTRATPASKQIPRHVPLSLASPKPATPVQGSNGRVASVTPAAAGAAFEAAALMTPRAAPAGERSNARNTDGGRSPGTTPAGALSPPKQLPPVPPAPRPDFTSPAQGGGQGQLAPLLVAALAAALAFARFPFRTRLLPRPAFRKPRRVALTVWHPG